MFDLSEFISTIELPIGLQITGILLLILIIIAFLFSIFLMPFKMGFSFKTPKRHLKKIFDAINLKESEIFADFGSGFGNIVFYALKFSPKKAVGFELSPVPIYFSRRKTIFHIKNRNKVEFFVADFNTTNLEELDVIYCNINKDSLITLEQRLIEDLNTKCRIFTYKNPFPLAQPLKVHEIENSENAKVDLYEYNAESFTLLRKKEKAEELSEKVEKINS